MRSLLFAAVVATLTACPLALAESAPAITEHPADYTERPADYASGFTLETDGNSPFYRVELPFALYSQARPDLADIRVFNRAGVSLPYALSTSQRDVPVAVPTVQTVAFFPFSPSANDDLSSDSLSGDNVDLRIEQDASGKVISLNTRQAAASEKPRACLLDLSALTSPVQAIRLEWPDNQGSYNDQVRIESSSDLKDWTLLGSDVLVDMEFVGQRLQQKRLALPAGNYRYLRLIASHPLPALSRVGVEIPPVTAAAPLRWHEVTAAHDDKQAEKPGEFRFDLGAYLTVSQVRVILPEGNAVLPGTLLARASSKDPWQPVAATVAWRLLKDNTDTSSPALEIAPQAGRYWLLRTDPRTASGIDSLRLTVGWRPEQLVFLVRGEPPFTLAYGKRDAVAMRLPLSSLVPGYRNGDENNFPEATFTNVDKPVDLGGRDAPPPGQEDKPGLDWHRYILWAVLLAGVALLAWMAFSLIKTSGDSR